MAKQTFSVGQVLSAAQMTSLQQTAMGGGAPVTKTASYTLVAADAGTVIQMNSASPTTITVNTSLFAAGDTVFIQNIGAGTCTVTAGTATVTTAGSLALTQWEGGTLYFTSTSASIFFDYIQAGVSIPLTTKGDLFGFDTANARVPIGSNGTVLTADSTQALGLKWAAPAGGSGLTLIKRATFSNVATTTTTFDNVFTSTYDAYLIVIEKLFASSSSDDAYMQMRGSATTKASGYYGSNYSLNYAASAFALTSISNAGQVFLGPVIGSSGSPSLFNITISQVGQGSSMSPVLTGIGANGDGNAGVTGFASTPEAGTYDGVIFSSSSSNISGTIAIYGLAK